MKTRPQLQRSYPEDKAILARQRKLVKHSAQAKRIGDVMGRAYYCFEYQPLDEAHKIMRENNLAFLSVVDNKMRIIGKVDLA